MKKTLIFSVAWAILAVQGAYAGQYATALGNCVYNNLNTNDKNIMVQ